MRYLRTHLATVRFLLVVLRRVVRGGDEHGGLIRQAPGGELWTCGWHPNSVARRAKHEDRVRTFATNRRDDFQARLLLESGTAEHRYSSLSLQGRTEGSSGLMETVKCGAPCLLTDSLLNALLQHRSAPQRHLFGKADIHGFRGWNPQDIHRLMASLWITLPRYGKKAGLTGVGLVDDAFYGVDKSVTNW